MKSLTLFALPNPVKEEGKLVLHNLREEGLDALPLSYLISLFHDLKSFYKLIEHFNLCLPGNGTRRKFFVLMVSVFLTTSNFPSVALLHLNFLPLLRSGMRKLFMSGIPGFKGLTTCIRATSRASGPLCHPTLDWIP